jgi:N-acetylmuramoyl-L-alanine amidase
MSKSDAEHQRDLDIARNRDEAIDVLARTIWGEARGESREGKIAVANVIMNRVARGTWYGRTVPHVCLKTKQFSCWNYDDPNREKLLAVPDTDPVFMECKEIATKAVDRELPDITGDATHYMVASITDRVEWDDNMKPTVRIGAHQFFMEV